MKHRNATVLPTAPNPINERPDNMSMSDYRELRKETNRTLKNRIRRGFLVHLAQEFLLDDRGQIVGTKFRKGQTFVGDTKFLQVI
jgi:hypothetical protein